MSLVFCAILAFSLGAVVARTNISIALFDVPKIISQFVLLPVALNTFSVFEMECTGALCTLLQLMLSALLFFSSNAICTRTLVLGAQRVVSQVKTRIAGRTLLRLMYGASIFLSWFAIAARADVLLAHFVHTHVVRYSVFSAVTLHTLPVF